MATDRAESFSDGVFAVAVTLLVLDLGVHHVRPGGLAAALGHEWPHYFTFVVSPLTVGIIWSNHHEMFERIARVDRPLVLLNLLLLLSVTVIPFTTGLLAGYLRGADEHVAAAVYAASFLLLSITFTATNTWSARRRLWRAGISSEEMSQQLGRASLGLLLYTAAVGLAFVNAIVSLVLCALSTTRFPPGSEPFSLPPDRGAVVGRERSRFGRDPTSPRTPPADNTKPPGRGWAGLRTAAAG